MDDVDRLFDCFKCGISPPQSAARERKTKKHKIKEGNSKEDLSTSVQFSSAVSTTKKQQSAADTDNFYTPAAKKKNFNNGSQFSPVVFYGSPQGVPPKRPARLLRLLHEIRVELAEQHKLSEDVWATFPRQDDAMKYAKQHIDVRIFSYQDHTNGQRRFLVSTYKEFWRRYKNMNSKFRHHYEVIQEGLPCHLYFDLEFNTRENAERNGDEMVDLLLLITFEALLEKYAVEGDNSWIVELDSSTKDKFSRHLIIRIPGIAFKDNTHVGAFVAEICSRLYSARERDKRFEQLFVSKDSSSAGVGCQLFVDTAVYSRNRCFRLHLSSKAGKSSVLLPTGRFKCKDMTEEDVFMVSLICNIGADCEKLLICKMDLDCVKVLQFDTEINSDFSKPSPREFVSNACTSDGYFMGKSPYPVLDEFVEYVASVGNIPGKIRSWYWFSEYGLMVYSMSRNRYCERIGRQHKSNHVIYVVDLQKAVYYQKCHDPDCKGYRSPLRPIPPEVIPDSVNYKLGGPKDIPEHVLPYTDESTMDSCKRDDWWHEAVVIAENVEHMPRMLDLTKNDEVYDEDDDWWMDVEKTASQIELMYCTQK